MLEKKFFNRWVKNVYKKRAYNLFQRRTGIYIESSSNRNYLSLKSRLRRLAYNKNPLYVSESLIKHLRSLPRNQDGLAKQEQFLFDRLYHGEWYLIHKTDKYTLEKTQQDGILLSTEALRRLSVEELNHRNIPLSSLEYSSTSFIHEVVDGIFFSISPGQPCGRNEWGDGHGIIIDPKKINLDNLHGTFTSGCIHKFHSRPHPTNKKIILHGTTCYHAHKQPPYSELTGLQYIREYYFEQPTGEIITHTVDRSSEIFTLPIMLQALCYTVIERIRQLGLSAWESIYTDIEQVSTEKIQELAKNILHPDVLEVHVPRSININQPGISVVYPTRINIDQRFAELAIKAAYEGNIEFLQNLPIEQLNNYSWEIEDGQFIDIVTAAILSGNKDMINFVCSFGFRLNGQFNGKTELNMFGYPQVLYIQRSELIIKIFAAMLNMEVKNSFSKTLICPGMSQEQKEALVLELLEKGNINLTDQNICYPFWLSAPNLKDISDDFANTHTFAPGSFKRQFIEILVKNEERLNPYCPLKIYTFLFKGNDPKTKKSWYLLEDAKHIDNTCPNIPYMFCVRKSRTALEPLDVRVDDIFDSEEQLTKIIASSYYAIPSNALKIDAIENHIEHHEFGEDSHAITVLTTIIDPVQNIRLMQDFSEHIVFYEEQPNPIHYSFVPYRPENKKIINTDALAKVISISKKLI